MYAEEKCSKTMEKRKIKLTSVIIILDKAEKIWFYMDN